MTDHRNCPECRTPNENERTYCWVCFEKLKSPDNPAPVQTPMGLKTGRPTPDVWPDLILSGYSRETPFGVVAAIVGIALSLLSMKSIGWFGMIPMVLVLSFLVKDSGPVSTALGFVGRGVSIFILIVISSVLLVILTCFRM